METKILYHNDIVVKGEQIGEPRWQNGCEFATVWATHGRRMSSGNEWSEWDRPRKATGPVVR